MATRDPNKTLRNKYINQLTDDLNGLLAGALVETGKSNVMSLNAYIGSKADEFIDLKHAVMNSAEDYINEWTYGMQCHKMISGREIEADLNNRHNKCFRAYVPKFLERSFLKRYDEFSKRRPEIDKSYYWFGNNDSVYGLFVTPRFRNGEWENDKSEIRVFSKRYWTIGHIIETGVCFPGEDRKILFADVQAWLDFLYAQIRLTKSQYQIGLVRKYEDYVLSSTNQEDVPLIIPEVRYDGTGKRHKHRLDFLVVNPFTMEQVGIEISPWSTHGQLSGKHKTMVELNNEARENWENGIAKVRNYYKRYKIYTIHYSDSDLNDMNQVFNDISAYLDPASPPQQMRFLLYSQYFGQ